MKKAKVATSVRRNNEHHILNVDGWDLEVGKDLDENELTSKHAFSVYKERDVYHVIEKSLGGAVSNDSKRKEAIKKANNILGRIDLKSFEEKLEDFRETLEFMRENKKD